MILPTPVGGRLFFCGADPEHGEEIWVSDGTAEGTVLFLDVVPGPGGSNPGGFTPAGNRVYFSAQDSQHGRELWVFTLDPNAPRFFRGDANGDGAVDLSDAVRILCFLFLDGSMEDCKDAADVDDDGQLNVTDPVRLLGYLFLGTEPPPQPFEACTTDPTVDALDCNAFGGCP